MKTSFSLVLIAALFNVLVPPRAAAQSADGWRDALIDHMRGAWQIEGRVMGHAAHHTVRAEWVLNHQFLQIHEQTSAAAPRSEHPYEAIWLLGYDAVSERYVLHLLDVFGGRYAETLGYGVRDGDEIRFVFEYPDGPFHTTYRWSAASDSWQWQMEQKGKNGKWTTFADLKLTRPRS